MKMRKHLALILAAALFAVSFAGTANAINVWDGTTGTVRAVDDEGLYVLLDVPYRDEVSGEMVDTVRFSKEMIKNRRYAYALTIHKSQGSQYRKVVLLLLSRDKFQLDRSLVYTGVTRTQKECIVIGDHAALEGAIAVQRKKNTCLQCLKKEASAVAGENKTISN